MRTGLLVIPYAAWPVGVLLLRVIPLVRKSVPAIRTRFLLVAALGWLAAVGIATTGAPAQQALEIGLPLGAGVTLFGWFAIGRGVTFEWSSNVTYDRFEGKIPWTEVVAGGFIGLLGVAGLVLALLP
jgi:hypothetical protein